MPLARRYVELCREHGLDCRLSEAGPAELCEAERGAEGGEVRRVAVLAGQALAGAEGAVVPGAGNLTAGGNLLRGGSSARARIPPSPPLSGPYSQGSAAGATIAGVSTPGMKAPAPGP